MIDFGRSPLLASHQLQELGFAVAVWPVSSVFVVSRALCGAGPGRRTRSDGPASLIPGSAPTDLPIWRYIPRKAASLAELRRFYQA